MSYNRDDQQPPAQRQQYQQQQQPRIGNPHTFNANPNINNNNTFYPTNNNTFQLNQQGSYAKPSNPYTFSPNEPINNYYQLQQQQQQLYQPQHQSQYSFQTFVPAQPPSLQPFNDPIVPTEPDEFIVDLLRKPQERLFLLKLELELEAFIKEKEKLRLDLPCMNSYQRLMVHKLAPYYKLNHYHDAMRKAVYVCRTFITELPTVRLQDVRLDDINNDASNRENNDSNSSNSNSGQQGEDSNSSSTAQPTPQFKIMRRSAGSSPSSRNATTEDASKETRKNMTFEERKTAYEEARARIFQDLEGK